MRFVPTGLPSSRPPPAPPSVPPTSCLRPADHAPWLKALPLLPRPCCPAHAAPARCWTRWAGRTPPPRCWRTTGWPARRTCAWCCTSLPRPAAAACVRLGAQGRRGGEPALLAVCGGRSMRRRRQACWSAAEGEPARSAIQAALPYAAPRLPCPGRAPRHPRSKPPPCSCPSGELQALWAGGRGARSRRHRRRGRQLAARRGRAAAHLAGDRLCAGGALLSGSCRAREELSRSA